MGTDKRGFFGATATIAIVGAYAIWLQSAAPRTDEKSIANKKSATPEGVARSLLSGEKQKESRVRKPHVGWMTARPRPASPPAKSLAVGEAVRTQVGERQRLILPDGSILYANEKTRLKLDGERQLTLSAGEIFLNVVRRINGPQDSPFVVRTAGREISALGAKLDIHRDAKEARVVVIQGQMSVNDLREIHAGQQIVLPSKEVSSAPRTSYLLQWVKELMVTAEAPLVPASKHAGGALVAVNPSGGEQALSLRKYHIDVHIEDGFARTTIDQTYFNDAFWRLEGTFYFPLPPDASLSRLAMYVDGTLMEGGMAERDYARQTFDSIVSRQKDPALLEWVDGNIFKMRVFPLEARQEKRIILSYTQRLPSLFGQAQYRFPSGHSLEKVGEWSFHALVKDGARLKWSSESPELRGSKQGPDLILEGQAQEIKLDRDVVLNLSDSDSGTGISPARFTATEQETGRYFMVRYRPELPSPPAPRPRDWVFLFECSAERNPLLARAQIEVIRQVLANANPEDTFVILAAGTRVQALDKEPWPVTPENINKAVEFLEQRHLVGALDLGRALTAAAEFLKAGKNPYLLHVGSALPTMGEPGTEQLIRRIPAKVCYVGVAVGKNWSHGFMKSAAGRRHGYLTQINPDEPIAWRTFELMSTLNLPRLLDVTVTAEGGKTAFLSDTSALTQGEELFAVARFDPAEKEGRVEPWIPKAVKVSGKLEGKPFQRILPVERVAERADYLPRFWAKLEIDRLLTAFSREPKASAEENTKTDIKAKIIELSKSMYVMSPFTSLLVLENEEMYRQYQVDRGRKDHWALYPLPPQIPVVREAIVRQPAEQNGQNPTPKPAPAGEKRSIQQVLQSIEVRRPPPILRGNNFDMPEMYLEDITAGEALSPVNLQPRYVDNRIYLLDLQRPVGPGVGGLGLGGLGIGLGLGGLGAGGLGAGGGGAVGLGGLGLGSPVHSLGMGGGLGLSGIGGFGGFGGGGMPGPLTSRIWWEDPDDEDPTVRKRSAPRFEVFWDRDSAQAIRQVREKLAQSVSLEFEANTPLEEVLSFLSDHFELNLVIDVYAIRNDTGMADVEDLPIRLPRLNNVRLGTVLGLVLKQVQGGFLVRPGYIEVISRPQPTELDENEFENNWSEILARRNLLSRARRSLQRSGGKLVLEGGVPVFQALPSTSWKVWFYESMIENSQRPAKPPLAAPGKSENSLENVIRQLRGTNVSGDFDKEVNLAQTKPAFRNDWQDADDFVIRLLAGLPFNDKNWLYQQPKFSGDERVFTYLTAYAPGMNTTGADVRSVLESEAEPDPVLVPGQINPYARKLIDQARKGGWRRVTIPEKNSERSFALVLDGSGRFALSRVLATGLREQVICDGENLWHLYPELGVGAHRTVSRFHRADLAMLVPWFLPPAEDLARGADLKYIDQQTVAIVPHAGQHKGQEVRLLFSLAGQLAERQLVDMRSDKMIYRETYDSDGEVRLLDSQGNVLAKNEFHMIPAPPPALKPDTDEFILSRLPLRNHHYSETGKTDRHDLEENVPKSSTLSLMAKHVAWRQLLKSGTGDRVKGLLQRLLDLHALFESRDKRLPEAELENLLRQVREGPKDALAWAMLSLIQERTGRDRRIAAALAELYLPFADCPGLGYGARYEHARALLASSRGPEARRLFLELYRQTLANGTLPRIDRSFRRALLGSGTGVTPVAPDEWTPLMRQTAAQLVAAKRRLEVVILAWQCRQIGDRALSEKLLHVALEGVGGDAQELPTKLAAIECLWQTHQLAAADNVLESLLTRPEYSGRSSLWRLGARLSQERRLPERFAQRLERAVEIDSQNLPEIVSLQAVRTDFGLLLDHYQQLAAAHAILQKPPPKDLADRVVRAVDSWRALDSDNPAPCVFAAQILDKLGEADLAWEYMNTPTALLGPDAEAWTTLAEALCRQESFALAERALEQAMQLEPERSKVTDEEWWHRNNKAI